MLARSLRFRRRGPSLQSSIGVMMKYLVGASLLCATALLAPGHQARAAPFCIRNQVLPAQCIYYDARECQREAERQNAECAPNPAQLHLTRDHGEYCVVSPSGAAVCAYADHQSCMTAATHQNGACVQADPNQPARQPNPYSLLNGQ